jgi:hypothetical protein
MTAFGSSANWWTRCRRDARRCRRRSIGRNNKGLLYPTTRRRRRDCRRHGNPSLGWVANHRDGGRLPTLAKSRRKRMGSDTLVLLPQTRRLKQLRELPSSTGLPTAPTSPTLPTRILDAHAIVAQEEIRLPQSVTSVLRQNMASPRTRNHSTANKTRIQVKTVRTSQPTTSA